MTPLSSAHLAMSNTVAAQVVLLTHILPSGLRYILFRISTLLFYRSRSSYGISKYFVPFLTPLKREKLTNTFLR